MRTIAAQAVTQAAEVMAIRTATQMAGTTVHLSTDSLVVVPMEVEAMAEELEAIKCPT